MFDILIKNGIVADGDSDETKQLDIAITAGSIAEIAPSIKTDNAKKVIDASGQIVAPGFVDVHSHSDYYLIIDNRASSKVLQGVTSEIGGNCGYSAAPMSGEVLERRAKDYKEQFGIDVNWSGMNEFLETLSDAKPAVNFGALLGYNTIRGSIMGPNSSQPSANDMKEIKGMIAQGLDNGALGMSVGVVYPPACFAKTEEFVEAYKVVAEKEKVFTSHIRSEGAGLLDALTEVTHVAKKSGAKLQVSHLKTAGKANWGKLDRAFEILESARADGVRLMADRYPYLASNTGLQVALPDRAFDGGRDILVKKLKDPKERDTFKAEILLNHPEAEYWNTVMVSQVVTERNKDIEGLTVAEGAKKRGKDIFTYFFDLLVEENTEIEAIFFCMTQENMDRIIEKPWVVIGSDAGARAIDGPLAIGRPHPRTFGTFPKFFKEYVREKQMFTIPEAVRKTTTYACDFFGIKNRGRLKKGWAADIVVFDINTIEDTSTYVEPLSYPTGINCVLVNGVLTVENGKETGRTGGTILTS